MTRWYYVEEGRRKGPVEMTQLVEILLALDAPEHALVWHPGMGEWTPAGGLDEIRRQLPPPVPGGPSADTEGERPALPSVEDLEAPGPDDAEGEVPAGASEAAGVGGEDSQHGRRRHRKKATPTENVGRFLLPLLLLLLAMVMGLWWLLRRINEVPPGQIITGALRAEPSVLPHHGQLGDEERQIGLALLRLTASVRPSSPC